MVLMHRIKWVLLVLTLFNSWGLFGQDNDTTNQDTRWFMPSIQMGYIGQSSDELSGGLLIQTSLEYRTKKHFFFRVNYDDFDTDFNLINPQNLTGNYSGKVSIAELLGGVGYRGTTEKHHFFLLVQPGFRFYGFPFITNENNNISIDLDNRNLPVMRYTAGYEYEFVDNVFAALELFAGHTLENKDYWRDQDWSWGFTVGISTTLF